MKKPEGVISEAVGRARSRSAEKLEELQARHRWAISALTTGTPAPPADPPGVKPGGKAAAHRLMWKIALDILNDPSRAPPRRHGWCIALARIIKPELHAVHRLQYEAESIAGII